jgi:hypothetical protein
MKPPARRGEPKAELGHMKGDRDLQEIITIRFDLILCPAAAKTRTPLPWIGLRVGDR